MRYRIGTVQNEILILSDKADGSVAKKKMLPSRARISRMISTVIYRQAMAGRSTVMNVIANLMQLTP